jgi:hypothetical protein
VKWQALQKLARLLDVENLTFIEKPMSWCCGLCPLDGKKCEEEKRLRAMRNPDNTVSSFDCYGALMRWLFWE